MRAYANPPWSLIGRVLAQAHQQEVLVAPVWKTQTWYPRILEMCMDYPRIIPRKHNLIQQSHALAMPPLSPHYYKHMLICETEPSEV